MRRCPSATGLIHGRSNVRDARAHNRGGSRRNRDGRSHGQRNWGSSAQRGCDLALVSALPFAGN